jgi:hypothetical protein
MNSLFLNAAFSLLTLAAQASPLSEKPAFQETDIIMETKDFCQLYATDQMVLEQSQLAVPGLEVEVTGIAGKLAQVFYENRLWYVYVSDLTEPSQEAEETEPYVWNGPVLTAFAGTVQGPTGKETYYNLDMSGCISIMNALGYDADVWVREDGAKMFGDYVMVAANLNLFPKGAIVPTSMGLGIVVDTGSFALTNPTQLDIAVTW